MFSRAEGFYLVLSPRLVSSNQGSNTSTAFQQTEDINGVPCNNTPPVLQVGKIKGGDCSDCPKNNRFLLKEILILGKIKGVLLQGDIVSRNSIDLHIFADP